MGRHMRPEKFEVFGVVDSVLFPRFLAKIEAGDEDRELLHNYISPNISECVTGCSTYAAAIRALEKMHITPPNKI